MKELEQLLDAQPRLGQAMAERLIKIVLKGGEQAAIRAAELIQDRLAGPPTQRVQAEIVAREIIVVGTKQTAPELPQVVRDIEAARLAAEERAQVKRQQER